MSPLYLSAFPTICGLISDLLEIETKEERLWTSLALFALSWLSQFDAALDGSVESAPSYQWHVQWEMYIWKQEQETFLLVESSPSRIIKTAVIFYAFMLLVFCSMKRATKALCGPTVKSVWQDIRDSWLLCRFSMHLFRLIVSQSTTLIISLSHMTLTINRCFAEHCFQSDNAPLSLLWNHKFRN